MRDLEALQGLAKHEFPAYTVRHTSPDVVEIITVHGVGASEEEALANALKQYADMKRDGQCVRQMLDDVITDLNEQRGMSRERHDSLCEILDIAGGAINDGVITNTVPWILVPSLTREITALRRRIDTRLNMVAIELQQEEAARKRAGTKFPRTTIPEGMTEYQFLRRQHPG